MAEETCPVCGEEHEGEWFDEHTLICLYQPSLHSLPEFYAQAILECNLVANTALEFTDEELDEFGEECLEEAEEQLPEGYVAVSDDDYWAIWQA